MVLGGSQIKFEDGDSFADTMQTASHLQLNTSKASRSVRELRSLVKKCRDTELKVLMNCNDSKPSFVAAWDIVNDCLATAGTHFCGSQLEFLQAVHKLVATLAQQQTKLLDSQASLLT